MQLIAPIDCSRVVRRILEHLGRATCGT